MIAFEFHHSKMSAEEFCRQHPTLDFFVCESLLLSYLDFCDQNNTSNPEDYAEYVSSGVALQTAPQPQTQSFSPIKSQAKSFVSAVTEHAMSGFKGISKELLSERQTICKTCDQLGTEGMMKGRCKACGCFMLVKARWKTSRCVLGKW